MTAAFDGYGNEAAVSGATVRIVLGVLGVSLILGLVAVPLTTEAHSTGKSYRVGLVSLGSIDPSGPGPWWQPLRDALRELGRLPGLIREVARLGVDVFVTTSTREHGR